MGAVRTWTNWVRFATIVMQVTSSGGVSVAVRNVLFNVLPFAPGGRVTWALVANQFG